MTRRSTFLRWITLVRNLFLRLLDAPSIRGLVCKVRDITERRKIKLRRAHHTAVTELVSPPDWQRKTNV